MSGTVLGTGEAVLDHVEAPLLWEGGLWSEREEVKQSSVLIIG